MIETAPRDAASWLDPWNAYGGESGGQISEGIIAHQRRRVRFEFTPIPDERAPTGAGVEEPDLLSTETPLPDYAQRTAWNVRDSDGTLILHRADASPGTNLTMKEAQSLGKPVLLLDLTRGPEPTDVTRWMIENEIHILNVAGPRESEAPGIYEAARVFLEEVFGQLW